MDLSERQWQQHRTRLRRYVAARVGDNTRVDDIVQDTLIRALAALNALRSPSSFEPWLYRIAARVIADHFRSLKPSEALSDNLTAAQPVDDPVAELATCLQPLIDELPETYRTALMLSEIEGLPQKHVAQHLGISLSGAKSRVQRGRRLLRDRVLACCEIEADRSGIVDYRPRDRVCMRACC